MPGSCVMDEVTRAFPLLMLARPACGVDLVPIEDDALTKAAKAANMNNAIRIEARDFEVLFIRVIRSPFY